MPARPLAAHSRADAPEPWLDALVYAEAGPDIPETIRLESVAFEDGAAIPPIFTADGEGCSPPLRWRGVPDGAAALVLIVEDADAGAAEPFVHVLAVKTPAIDDDLIPDALREENALTEGLLLGLNGRGEAAWTPPDPPAGDGPHHYVAQIFAVTRRPDAGALLDRTRVVAFLKPNALAKGCVTGLFERSA